MISYKSCLAFVYINSFVFLLNYLNLVTFVRNSLILLFIEIGTNSKNKIHDSVYHFKTKDLLYFCSSNLIQTITELFIEYYLVRKSKIYFIVRLFAFEICLDFFHYIAHRISHTFYRFHKVHHHYPHPVLINTYYHHPMDLILIDCIPTLLSFWIVPFNSVSLVLIYKSFIEISGHSGKYSTPSSCFPICVWLPRLLGIELYTEDHDLHHSENIINFSKRFSLWDHVFGTFKRCVKGP